MCCSTRNGDETTFRVLKEPGRRPQSKSYPWAQFNGLGPPVQVFSYSRGRRTQRGGITSALTCDAPEFIGGVPELPVPDSPKTLIARPDRCDPGLGTTTQDIEQANGKSR